jgi:hypothetical protein
MEKERYWLRAKGTKWQEVDQGKFVEAERSAGFYPKAGCGPVATAGFSNGSVEGQVTYDGKRPRY